MDKKVIMITGANSDIGSSLAVKFNDEGYCVQLLVHKNMDHIQELLSKNNVYFHSCELNDLDNTQTAIDQIITESGKLPFAFIHTATIRSNDSSTIIDSDSLKWKETLITNVISAYHAVKAVLPYMVSQHTGRIVLFGSDVSRTGLKNGSAYAASKSAISNLCRSLSLELSDSGILVNTLSPGPVETNAHQFDPKYRVFRENYFKTQLMNIPLKRIAQVSDIYPLCKFLISEENTYLTGEEIFVTGGKL